MQTEVQRLLRQNVAITFNGRTFEGVGDRVAKEASSFAKEVASQENLANFCALMMAMDAEGSKKTAWHETAWSAKPSWRTGDIAFIWLGKGSGVPADRELSAVPWLLDAEPRDPEVVCPGFPWRDYYGAGGLGFLALITRDVFDTDEEGRSKWGSYLRACVPLPKVLSAAEIRPDNADGGMADASRGGGPWFHFRPDLALGRYLVQHSMPEGSMTAVLDWLDTRFEKHTEFTSALAVLRRAQSALYDERIPIDQTLRNLWPSVSPMGWHRD